MTIKEGFRAELAGDATLAALVSDAVSPLVPRIWSEFARQGDNFPYIVYDRTHMTSSLTLDGVDTLRNIGFRVDVFGSTVSSVEAVKDRVRTLLDGKSGTLGSEVIQFCSLETEQDLSDLEDEAIRRTSLFFTVIAHEG